MEKSQPHNAQDIEPLKDKATEGLTQKVWNRLSERSKLPRWLWFPPKRHRELDVDEWKRQHDEVSISLRRTMITMLGYSFFCVLTLAAPDVSLIARDAKINVPFAGTEVSYQAFLIIGPLTMFGLAIYLHILLGHWLSLGKHEETFGLPYIFNINNKAANWLANFIFYWLPCLVLAFFSWKALPRPNESILLIIQTAVFFSCMVLLKIRRFPDDQHRFKFNALYLFVWLLGVCLLLGPQIGFYQRSLDLFRADLSKKDLRNTYLFKATLIEADLNGADLRGADLQGANLQGANLSEAVLPGAYLPEAKLQRADLSGAILSGAVLPGADLSGAMLSKADLSEAMLLGTKLSKADLSEANLSGAILSIGKLSKADLSETPELSRADLSGAILSKADLSGAKLSEADLSGADLWGAKLSKADLSKADLWGADLSGANLSGADLSGADLSGAKLSKADLSEAFALGTKLSKADLSEANLSGAMLSIGKLSKADLSETPELSGADLSGAKLSKADLSGTDLSGTKGLTVEQLCEASILYEAKLDQELKTQVKQECPDLFKKPQKSNPDEKK